ncbi:MAG: FGGY-family carbohydrate kinase [Deltaproteobacteria bacterium]|nr:FGGY-family carbohydrate kinase [Deltaproteobacteria bacterium]
MYNRDLILSIDNGTQSLRAMLFDSAGNIVIKEKVEFAPYFSEKPGRAEQDPQIFWNALCAACKKIWQKGDYQKRIAGAALTTQRATVVNVDKNGEPLRPAIIWLDQRKAGAIPTTSKGLEAFLKITGINKTVEPFRQKAKSNWIKYNQKDIWDNTYKYLLLSGYLTYKLTGEFKDSSACQVGYLPFNYKKNKWEKKQNWKWKILGLEPNLMPKLYNPGKVIGVITKKASQASGIPEAIPLIACAADKACEVLGTGSVTPNACCISYGTTATINITEKKYIKPSFLLPAYPAAIPEHYLLEEQIYRGYWMISWFKEEFGYKEKLKAKQLCVAPEVLFDKLIKDIPPGSMGLMLQPYWTPGIKYPGPEAKGAVIGFGDVHTKGYFYKAILEGLAYGLREGKEKLEKRTKQKTTKLYITGGGSQSDQTMQITADIFGMNATRGSVYETSGLGAAIIAAVGLNLHKDWYSAIEAMTATGEVFKPSRKNYDIYNRLYQKVYKKMYKRLKPFYKDIKKITGYP